jgi:glycine C-acetyltransferase
VLDDLRAKGTHFKLRVLDDQQAPVCHYDGREVINLASNNYLGLANHPKLIEAAIAATRAFGVGSGAVRTIAGTMRIHMELEEKIARFKNVEACVVFQSGFAANAGTVSAILGKEDFILSDELNHASIIDGARLSRATIKVFRHKDAAHCEELLQELENSRAQAGDHRRRFLDGWRHRPGRQAGRAGREIRRHHDGRRCARLGRAGPQRARIGRSLWNARQGGCAGGHAVEGHRRAGRLRLRHADLIDYLYHRARPFLFSTSHPPSVAATCIAAFDILELSRSAFERLWSNTRYFQGELKRWASTSAASTRRRPRRRSRRSSWARAARPWTSAARSSTRA